MPTTRVVRINPQASIEFIGWARTGSASSSDVILTDGSDTTYIEQTGVFPQYHSAIYPMQDATVPTGARIWAVMSVIRFRETTGKAFQGVPQHWTGIAQRVIRDGIDYYNWAYINALPSSFWTYTFGFWRRPSSRGRQPTIGLIGNEWTIEDVNSLEMQIIVYQQPDPQDHQVAEAYFDVHYNAKPELTIISPSEGSTLTDTTLPLITWDWADDEGDPQESYRVKVFDPAQYNAADFDPETSKAYWDSGKVYSGTSKALVGLNLQNNTTYRVYVKGWQPWPGAEFSSDWSSRQFTVTLDTPELPTMTVTAEPAATLGPRVALAFATTDNILGKDNASFEANLGDWIAGNANTNAPTRSTAQFVHGGASLSMTAAGVGDIYVYMPGSSTVSPVASGEAYTLAMSFRSATVSRTARIGYSWYDSAGALISTFTAADTATSTTAWTRLSVNTTAPANAAYIRIRAFILAAGAAGEEHFVDAISLRPGTGNSAFVAGGFTTGTKHDAVGEFSDDGGTTWTKHPRLRATWPRATQRLTLYDYEIPPNVTRQYRLKTIAMDSDEFASAYTAAQAASVGAFSDWWLKDPQDDTRNMKLFMIGESLDMVSPEQAAAYGPLSQDYKLVIHDAIYGEEFELRAEFINQTEYDKFETLRNGQRTLLLQSPMTNQQWYLRMKGNRSVSILNTAEPLRRVAIDVVEQPMPE